MTEGTLQSSYNRFYKFQVKGVPKGALASLIRSTNEGHSKCNPREMKDVYAQCLDHRPTFHICCQPWAQQYTHNMISGNGRSPSWSY